MQRGQGESSSLLASVGTKESGLDTIITGNVSPFILSRHLQEDEELPIHSLDASHVLSTVQNPRGAEAERNVQHSGSSLEARSASGFVCMWAACSPSHRYKMEIAKLSHNINVKHNDLISVVQLQLKYN